MLIKHPDFKVPFQTNLVQICSVQENSGINVIVIEMIGFSLESYKTFQPGSVGKKKAEKYRDELIIFINEKNKA